MSAHRIRLDSAWELRLFASDTDPAPLVVSIALPARRDSLVLPDGARRFALRRTFHRPSGLAPSQSVVLRLAGLLPGASATLNAAPIDLGRCGVSGQTEESLAEICDRLLDRNTLEIVFEAQSVDGSAEFLLRGAVLEIAEPAGSD